jgi:Uri superfamily endonuclease
MVSETLCGKGIYSLLFKNSPSCVAVGSLGEVTFNSGWHIYVGSALGPGGLKRALRHAVINRDKCGNLRWHVDYISASPDFSLEFIVAAKNSERRECEVAGNIGGISIRNFGCSDCGCGSHLFCREVCPLHEVYGAFIAAGLVPFTAETIF